MDYHTARVMVAVCWREVRKTKVGELGCGVLVVFANFIGAGPILNCCDPGGVHILEL